MCREVLAAALFLGLSWGSSLALAKVCGAQVSRAQAIACFETTPVAFPRPPGQMRWYGSGCRLVAVRYLLFLLLGGCVAICVGSLRRLQRQVRTCFGGSMMVARVSFRAWRSWWWWWWWLW